MYITCDIMSSERSFSALKRIKTSIGSSMGNERLTALTLLHIHRDVEIDVEVIDEDIQDE